MTLTKAHELFPKIKIFGAGKSFGGRMTSQCLSKTDMDFVGGLIFYGFPLHPAGTPGIDRAEHLKSVKQPMLFLQGTRDALAELTLIKQVTGNLKGSALELFEGADHSFKSGKKEFIPELAAASIRWIGQLK
jgi:predicted alpha/beta-hydrolase family hydrolase